MARDMRNNMNNRPTMPKGRTQNLNPSNSNPNVRMNPKVPNFNPNLHKTRGPNPNPPSNRNFSPINVNLGRQSAPTQVNANGMLKNGSIINNPNSRRSSKVKSRSHLATNIFIISLSLLTTISLGGTAGLVYLFSTSLKDNAGSIKPMYTIEKIQPKPRLDVLLDEMRNADSMVMVTDSLNRVNDWDDMVDVINKEGAIVKNAIKGLNATTILVNETNINYLLTWEFEQGYFILPPEDKFDLGINKIIIETPTLKPASTALLQGYINASGGIDSQQKLDVWLKETAQKQKLADLFHIKGINVSTNIFDKIEGYVVKHDLIAKTYDIEIKYSLSQNYISNEEIVFPIIKGIKL